MAGNADTHILDPRRVEGVVDDPLVVRVTLLFRRPRRERPIVHGGFDSFHRQVGTLDDADLDSRATPGSAGSRPFLQMHHCRERIGQICLQNNSGLEPGELGSVQDLGEDRNRDVEILEFLHVEVDEGL